MMGISHNNHHGSHYMAVFIENCTIVRRVIMRLNCSHITCIRIPDFTFEP